MEDGTKIIAGSDAYNSDVCCRFAKISIGEPPQEVEVDLDMLLSDFYVVTTTSSTGSRYDDYFSQSYGMCHFISLKACFQCVLRMSRYGQVQRAPFPNLQPPNRNDPSTDEQQLSPDLLRALQTFQVVHQYPPRVRYHAWPRAIRTSKPNQNTIAAKTATGEEVR